MEASPRTYLPDAERARSSWLRHVRWGAGLLLRLVLGLVVLALVLGAAVWVFLRASLPPVTGRATLPGLRAPVTIWRDRWAVPTIRAGSVEDAVRALGFVHASERLWQMELRRRAAAGTLSEVLGPVTLGVDEEARRFGLAALGRRDFERAGEPIRRIALAYTEGVNAWIARHRWTLPPEFVILRFRPRPWAPEECFAFARLMMLNLTQSRDFELARFDRFPLLGPDRALDLIRLEPGGPDEPFRPAEIPAYFARAAPPTVPATPGETRDPAAMPSPGAGSNAFAIGPEKTARSGALLASDPHLPVEMPGVWFEAAILAPEFEARGLTLAGVPGIVMGRNRHVAFGITVHQSDDTDLFIERVDATTSPPRVLRPSGWQPLREHVEEIAVRGAPPVPIELLDSDRGYVLPAGAGRPAFSVACAALAGDGPLPPFWDLFTTRDAQELVSRLGRFSGTPLNFTFADDRGTIGSQVAGFLPLRRGGDGRLPTPAWSAEFGWDGRIPPGELPGTMRRAGAGASGDPPVGPVEFGAPEPVPASQSAFSVTANNRWFQGDGPDPYPGEWSPPFRADRIAERLRGSDGWTVDEAAALQNDVSSAFARRVVRAVGAILADRPAGRPLPGDTARAMAALGAWDFKMERQGASRLFSEAVRALVEAVAGDEARASGSGPIVSPWGLLGILEGRAREEWFDDVGTPAREAAWETVAKGLSIGWERTVSGADEDPSSWSWAAVHRVAFEHPLGRPTGLSRWLDPRPVGMPGDAETVNAQAWSIRRPFRIGLIPSARQVFDLKDPDRSVAVCVPGQSGHPLSPHYADQLRLWATGATRPAPFTEAAAKAASVVRLELVPDREFR